MRLRQRQIGARPPQDAPLQPLHEAQQLRRRIVEEPPFQGARKADDAPLGALGGGQGDGGGPIAERRDAVIGVIDVAFGKNHQRIGTVAQDFDGLAKGVQVGAFAVDAEAAMLLQRPLLETAAHGEDLPRRHEMERMIELVGHLIQDVGIVMKRVVRRDEDACALAQRLAKRPQPLGFNANQALIAAQGSSAQRAKDAYPPGTEFREPVPGRCGKRLAIHAPISE